MDRDGLAIGLRIGWPQDREPIKGSVFIGRADARIVRNENGLETGASDWFSSGLLANKGPLQRLETGRKPLICSQC